MEENQVSQEDVHSVKNWAQGRKSHTELVRIQDLTHTQICLDLFFRLKLTRKTLEHSKNTVLHT